MGRPDASFAPSNKSNEPIDPDYEQFTPLMRAALFGTVGDVRRLASNGADVNAVSTPLAITALMCAAHDAEKARVLITAGADVNAKTKTGHTALVIAANYLGAVGTVKALLERGADVNARTTRPSFLNSALASGVSRGDRELIKTLLERGSVLNDFPNASSAYARAVMSGDAPTASFLLERGAARKPPPFVSAGAKQTTLLMWAITRGYADVVRLLLARGESVDDRDADGWTPLHYAAAARDRGDNDVIQMILDRGGDPQALTAAHETPMDLARRYGKSAEAELLRGAVFGRK
jgi:ankyrin repeat protein